MEMIYNDKTERFSFLDLTFDEVTIIENALIEFATNYEKKENECKDLIDCCDFAQCQAF